MRASCFSTLICGLVLVIFSGCASAPLLTESELPVGSRLVAGGLSLQWRAPEDGTVIFLEANSGTIVKSQSIEAGDQFAFNPLKPENVDLLNRLFSRRADLTQAHSLLPLPRNALFLLYFAPSDAGDEMGGVPISEESTRIHLIGVRPGRFPVPVGIH